MSQVAYCREVAKFDAISISRVGAETRTGFRTTFEKNFSNVNLELAIDALIDSQASQGWAGSELHEIAHELKGLTFNQLDACRLPLKTVADAFQALGSRERFMTKSIQTP